MDKVVLTSTNRFKVHVYKDIFQKLGYEFAVADNIPEILEPYDNLHMNALCKLNNGIKNYKCEYDYMIADDTGLFVPSINGYPGAYTKRETERFEKTNGAESGINSTIKYIIERAGGKKAKIQSSIIIYDNRTRKQFSIYARTYGTIPTKEFQYENDSNKPWIECILRTKGGGYSSIAFRDARLKAVKDILNELDMYR